MAPVRVLLYRLVVVWSLDFAFICSVWDIIEAARPGTMRYPTPGSPHDRCGGAVPGSERR
jgi:hypothetical protein